MLSLLAAIIINLINSALVTIGIFFAVTLAYPAGMLSLIQRAKKGVAFWKFRRHFKRRRGYDMGEKNFLRLKQTATQNEIDTWYWM